MNFDPLYPSPIDISPVTKKTRFFLGGKWILIGEITLVSNKKGLDITVPDIEGFLRSRQFLDDGTFDWLDWGPRMN